VQQPSKDSIPVDITVLIKKARKTLLKDGDIYFLLAWKLAGKQEYVNMFAMFP